MLGAKALFDELEYPAMMHCKSGADRAGVMSVLYMHFRKGLPIREAIRQLHLKFGHVRAGQTGVLDYSFERYLEEAEPKGSRSRTGSKAPPTTRPIKRDFRAKWWGTLLSEKLLRRE